MVIKKSTFKAREFSRQESDHSSKIQGFFSPTRPVVNISRGGARIYLDKLVKVGEDLKIEFFFPGSEGLKAEAKVVWIREVKKNLPGKYQAGLKFTKISQRSLDILLNLKAPKILDPKDPIIPNLEDLKTVLGTTAATACIAVAVSGPASANTLKTETTFSVFVESFNDGVFLVTEENTTDAAL